MKSKTAREAARKAREEARNGKNKNKIEKNLSGKLDLLTTKSNRIKVKEKFGIPLTSDKKFDTSEKINAEKLVKVLCNKAMWDILEDTPVEVDGSKSWER